MDAHRRCDDLPKRLEGAVAQLERLQRPSRPASTTFGACSSRGAGPPSDGPSALRGPALAEAAGSHSPMPGGWLISCCRYRGDSHTAAWTAAGFDAVEIGLLTELYWGLRLRTACGRAWSADELDAGEARLVEQGLIEDRGLTEQGRARREEVEQATDRQCRPIVEALGDALDELVDAPHPVGAAIRDAGGYLPSGPRPRRRPRDAARGDQLRRTSGRRAVRGGWLVGDGTCPRSCRHRPSEPGRTRHFRPEDRSDTTRHPNGRAPTFSPAISPRPGPDRLDGCSGPVAAPSR